MRVEFGSLMFDWTWCPYPFSECSLWRRPVISLLSREILVFYFVCTRREGKMVLDGNAENCYQQPFLSRTIPSRNFGLSPIVGLSHFSRGTCLQVNVTHERIDQMAWKWWQLKAERFCFFNWINESSSWITQLRRNSQSCREIFEKSMDRFPFTQRLEYHGCPLSSIHSCSMQV